MYTLKFRYAGAQVAIDKIGAASIVLARIVSTLIDICEYNM